MTIYSDNHKKIFNIALIGILMSLTIVFKAIFNYIPVLNGYPIDVYIAIYILSLLLINSYLYKWIFLLLTPWVLLLVPSGAVNFLDLLLEYILSLYVFFPLIYFFNIINLLTYKVNNKKIKLTIQIIFFCILVLILFTIKFVLHLVAGYLWYTPGNWYASMVINAQIIFLIYGIDTPIVLLCYSPINKLYQSIYGNPQDQTENSDTCIQV